MVQMNGYQIFQSKFPFLGLLYVFPLFLLTLSFVRHYLLNFYILQNHADVMGIE